MEDEGMSTAGISLIRPHTETIKPPRALWVPFQLGRPLGPPDDAPFQKRVLIALLKLLEAPHGPVLEDFSEDEPESDEITVLACPVNFARAAGDSDDSDEMLTAFRREMTAMRPWYDMAVDKRQRTTVGVSGIGIDGLGDFIYSFIQGVEPENPRDDVTLPFTLKLAAEDLKAFYNEGITAQPGQEGISSKAVKDWFWNDTVAGEVLVKLVDVCKKSPDKDLSNVAAHYLVPLDVMSGKK